MPVTRPRHPAISLRARQSILLYLYNKGGSAIAKLTREEREQIGRRRVVSVLGTHTVANLRTLEQKIADAGPGPQRIDPHILTVSKRLLIEEGRVIVTEYHASDWLHLDNADPELVAKRLSELQPLWAKFTSAGVVRRTGQALEIAVYRAILASGGAVIPIGGFRDLNAHDDSHLYSKEDNRVFNGRSLGERSLDFLVIAGGHFCGIEVKNIRPWLYPHDDHVKEAIDKALTLDVIPVLIARRIPFVTFKVLSVCGVIMHQTLRQRMASADQSLADRVRHKNALGYHDILVGNDADHGLNRFMQTSLPALTARARERLEKYRDLLESFSSQGMPYAEFAARVRRREAGVNEDGDWESNGPEGEVDDLFDQ